MNRTAIAFGVLLLSGAVSAQGAEAPQLDVLGVVARSRLPVRPDLTVLEATIEARPRAGADLGTVVVLRTTGLEVLALEVDVRAMLRTGNAAANVTLRPGDIVIVPAKEPSPAAARLHRRLFAVLAAVDDAQLEVERRVPLLAWRLETDFDVVRRQRVIADLGVLAEKAAPAVPQLVKALSTQPLLAREAATTLGLIGAAAEIALPALEQSGKSEDAALRARAAAAIRQIRAAVRAQ